MKSLSYKRFIFREIPFDTKNLSKGRRELTTSSYLMRRCTKQEESIERTYYQQSQFDVKNEKKGNIKKEKRLSLG